MQRMTAQVEDQDRERGCVWFFTARDHDLTRALGADNNAIASYACKGHELFASLRGRLILALVRTLQRCPCCNASVASTRD